MPLSAQDVAEIIRLLEGSDFLELRIEHEGLKLTLKRAGAGGADSTAAPARSPAAAAVAASWSPPESATPQPEASAARDPTLIEVTAPLMGIFYRAPRPGAAPYVEVGSALEEHTVIGIIEVMKLMNSVRAEVRGTVVEILVEDGAAVEQGQVLLRAARGSPGG
ncbi:MAG TPA: acetyl-CoA carboxylase biotin carboxyl carrier protein [Steroidobacteraceae bacterium]|nr:acetyl-CoA carboxylase biotin carboxyl carrier protein [Steroidobacteraceae bacterium]